MNGLKTAFLLLILCAPGPLVSAEDPTPIAVLPMGLSSRAAERYPQLAQQDVGFGIHNMLVNHLYDTGNYRMVEEKKEILDDVLERQWMSASGAIDQASAVQYGQLLGARFVVYGEVYDFSVRKIKRKTAETTIAIQIRFVDVQTAEYIPGSAVGVVTQKGGVFPDDMTEFARSTVGLATDAALQKAVGQLNQRLSERY